MDINRASPAHNLPARHSLVGREDLVATVIDGLLSERGPSSGVLLYGSPGVGKSSVALEVGHRMLAGRRRRRATRARDVIWIAAQPARLTRAGFLQAAAFASTLSDAITVMCTTLGREDILRAMPEHMIGLVHAELARRRVLVIFDGLDDVQDERVRSLLADLPHPTLALATSRERLPFGQPVEVQPLDDLEARQLAQRLDSETFGGIDKADQDTLLRAAGGVPLAIAWSLALLATGEEPAHALAQLERAESDLLRFCFERLWRSLSGYGGEVLKSLALFPTGASLPTVSFVSGLEEAISHQGVVELRNRVLIGAPDDRIVLLPMTRAYTMGQADHESANSIRRARWAEEICAAAVRAVRLPRCRDVLRALEERRADTEDFLAWSAENSDTSSARRAAVLWADLSYFLFSGGYWDTLLRHRRWAGSSLLDQGLVEEYLGAVLSWAAHVLMLRGEADEREALFVEAEGIIDTSEADTDLHRAMLDVNRADGRITEENIQARTEIVERATAVFTARRRDRWAAMASNRLGNLLVLGRLDEERAAAAYEDAMEVAGRHSDRAWARELVAIAQGNLGILANRRGDAARALELLQMAQPDITQAFDSATLTMELAIARYQLGQRRAAAKLGRQAREDADRLRVGVTIGESDPQFEKDVLPTLDAGYRSNRRQHRRGQEG
jgi:tetratricopeptide (TPR) repeat protein